MKFLSKVIIIALLASSHLSALIVKNQIPGCFTQSSLSEFLNAIGNRDTAGMGRLIMKQECFLIQPGTSYGVVKKQSSISLIRVYWDSDGYKL